MGPILAIHPTFTCQEHMKPMLFCHLDLSQHKKWMHQHQIGMDYLYAVVFTHYSASGIDRDKILVSKPMFFWMMNPMMTLKNPYNSWLTRNSKWLSLKPVEIILIGPCMGTTDPICTCQERIQPILFCY